MASSAFICETCGTQFAPSAKAPAACPICADERQYVGRHGQRWTTLEELRKKHRNRVAPERGAIAIETEPDFAIGQRALLIEADEGNILWDCVASIDDETVAAVEKLGGISAIAISHPHYYTTMVEWSRAFGCAPIYLHAADRDWVMRPDKAIQFWEGDTHPFQRGFTLVRCGGHFEGATVLHQEPVADQPGVLYTGDIIQVCADQRWVSFMRSYPNMIPLRRSAIERITRAVEPFSFDTLHGAFAHQVVVNAKEVVRRSAARYLRAIAEG
jgi:DNA-directed RNA polymerase subunit RPC12/RpoP